MNDDLRQVNAAIEHAVELQTDAALFPDDREQEQRLLRAAEAAWVDTAALCKSLGLDLLHRSCTHRARLARRQLIASQMGCDAAIVQICDDDPRLVEYHLSTPVGGSLWDAHNKQTAEKLRRLIDAPGVYEEDTEQAVA